MIRNTVEPSSFYLRRNTLPTSTQGDESAALGIRGWPRTPKPVVGRGRRLNVRTKRTTSPHLRAFSHKDGDSAGVPCYRRRERSAVAPIKTRNKCRTEVHDAGCRPSKSLARSWLGALAANLGVWAQSSATPVACDRLPGYSSPAWGRAGRARRTVGTFPPAPRLTPGIARYDGADFPQGPRSPLRIGFRAGNWMQQWARLPLF